MNFSSFIRFTPALASGASVRLFAQFAPKILDFEKAMGVRLSAFDHSPHMA